MTEEEVRNLARQAANMVADAMSAYYDDDHEWFRKVISTIKADPYTNHLALQCTVMALVQAGVKPTMFRDMAVGVTTIEVRE